MSLSECMCVNVMISCTRSLFLFQGRFTIAAKHHINIAEVYETEMADLDKVSFNPFAFPISEPKCAPENPGTNSAENEWFPNQIIL